MKRDRYFKSLTALNILILCATIAIRLGAPAHAKAQTLSSQSGAEDLKSLDDFFNDHDNLASVSYTHLDVYKRQVTMNSNASSASA